MLATIFGLFGVTGLMYSKKDDDCWVSSENEGMSLKQLERELKNYILQETFQII